MEEGRGEGGKVALLLSLSQHSEESATLRRVKHLKELSIDNKRMYCGLHGYSLVIGEDLHSSRAAEWDAVKLLAQSLSAGHWAAIMLVGRKRRVPFHPSLLGSPVHSRCLSQ